MGTLAIVGIAVAGLYVGSLAAKGVKKVHHQIGCVAKSGHKCPKPGRKAAPHK